MTENEMLNNYLLAMAEKDKEIASLKRKLDDIINQGLIPWGVRRAEALEKELTQKEATICDLKQECHELRAVIWGLKDEREDLKRDARGIIPQKT